MCHDGESDPQPFGVWDNTPTNLATSQGETYTILLTNVIPTHLIEKNILKKKYINPHNILYVDIICKV